MSASEFGVGTGGYMPNGYPRLFDTSRPVDGNEYGTPGLAGDYGNVLIVQQTGGSAQWKANENGGVISFDFVTPVDEVVELGLLNVVEEVWVKLTDADDATHMFVVESGDVGSYKNIEIKDVTLVTRIDVYLPGPVAITHLGICHDASDTSSSPWPTDMPSTVPSKSPAPSTAPSISLSPSSSPSFCT